MLDAIEHLHQGRRLGVLAQERQDVFLQRLTCDRGTPAEDGVHLLRHALDLDARHKARLRRRSGARTCRLAPPPDRRGAQAEAVAFAFGADLGFGLDALALPAAPSPVGGRGVLDPGGLGQHVEVVDMASTMSHRSGTSSRQATSPKSSVSR